ncbi:MAG: methylmalonyl Co-A mutase-associated GTPase MeaB, partial [Psychrobacillus psychrotolerans]
MSKTDNNNESSLHVMNGIKSQHDGVGKASIKRFSKRKPLQINEEEYIGQIQNGSRLHLAKAITYIE